MTRHSAVIIPLLTAGLPRLGDEAADPRSALPAARMRGIGEAAVRVAGAGPGAPATTPIEEESRDAR